MSLISVRQHNEDVFQNIDWLIHGSKGEISYSYFLTSLGNYFVTSDGKYFKVRS